MFVVKYIYIYIYMKSKLLFLKMENNGGANHELMLVICAYITQGVVRKNDIVEDCKFHVQIRVFSKLVCCWIVFSKFLMCAMKQLCVLEYL